MLTLGQFTKDLRGERTQNEIARACQSDHTLISILESDQPVRAKSLEKIYKHGLKVSATDWETAKLLWLEQQFKEPVFTKTAATARKALHLREATSHQEFFDKLESSALRNMGVINKNQLQPIILSLFENPRLLQSLKQFNEVFRSLGPGAKVNKE